jgi:hypothetical protein
MKLEDCSDGTTAIEASRFQADAEDSTHWRPAMQERILIELIISELKPVITT